MRLLYYCPFADGGIVDYAYAQARALSDAGADVLFVTVTGSACSAGQSCLPVMQDEARPIAGVNRLVRQTLRSASIVANILRLGKIIRREQIQQVLFATYSEYAAPLWAFELRKLARSGVRFSAVLHDPVRDYVVGPAAWHRWSVQEGYSFLHDIFVHEATDSGQTGIPANIRVSVIPHGPYEFPMPDESGKALRSRLEIPQDVKLLLSFGQIRNGKNLDLIIRALSRFDNLWLLVAGKEAAGENRPVTEYQRLAETSGVSERCRWVADYIPAGQVGSYFEAADALLLTYSRAFRSASGVLNAAVQFRKPCIASAGAGALRTQVQRYRLGVWIEPDDPEALCAGLNRWVNGIPEPLWSEYQHENSWGRNAQIVLDRLLSPQ